MSFFSAVVKVFTPMYEPPHPNLLWDLPESAVANECLPDHQNNAMFIPEAHSQNISLCMEPDTSNFCLLGASQPNAEIFADPDIYGRERTTLTASEETQRIFNEVDLWLEGQCNNMTPPRPSCLTIPHHLSAQLGLANSNNPASIRQTNCYHGIHLLEGNFGNEQLVVEERSFESVDVNTKIRADLFNKGLRDDCTNGVSPSELTVSERGKSPSSLSQLFYDELNEEDMKEVARSVLTVNGIAGKTEIFLNATIGNSRAPSKQPVQQQFSSQFSNLPRTAYPKQINKVVHHEPSGGAEIVPNDTEDITYDQGSSDLRTTMAKVESIPEVLAVPPILTKSSPKIIGIVETPSTPRLIPVCGEMPTPLVNRVSKILDVMKTPLKLDSNPKILETQQNSHLKPIPIVIGIVKTPEKRSPHTNETVQSPQIGSRITDLTPKSEPKMASNEKTHTPVPANTPNDEVTRRSSSGKLGNSPKIRNASSKHLEGFKEIAEIPSEPDDNSRANKNDVVSEQTLQTQSSLSQLFQTQEFTVDQYMEMVRSDFHEEPGERKAGSSRVMDEEVSLKSVEEITGSAVEVRGNPVKMNPQPFVIKGHEPKLFDISIKREEDRPWKKQVTEGVLEPSNEVSKRDEKSAEEIPMVVSPYFPNDGSYPVQDDKRTTPPDLPEQVLYLSQEGSSHDILGKILNYELATDDYQICKDFFSQRSPPQTPKLNSIPESRKRGKRIEEGTTKTKKPRISKKGQVDNKKITDYFSVVKKGAENEPNTKANQTKVDHNRNQTHSEFSQEIETSSGKFQFDVLPSGARTKMSNFCVPQSNYLEKTNLFSSSFSRECHGATNAVPPRLDQNAHPANVYSNNQVSTRSPPINEHEDTHEFNWSQLVLRPVNDTRKVIHLIEEKVEEVASAMEGSGDLLEIGFTICYRQKYSRLNMPDDGEALHKPCGIMSRVEFSDGKTLVLYQDTNGLTRENGRSFLMCLLESKCRKVCFEAQAFIMFVLDVLREQDLRICYDWDLLDPMVAMWLIDPDHPPQNFSFIINELDLKVVKSESVDWKLTVSRYLTAQTSSMEQLSIKLTELGLWDVFYRMETPVTPVLAVSKNLRFNMKILAMELRNIEVDYSRLEETSKALQKKMLAVERDAWHLVGRKFQMSSPVQLRKVLYEELKLDEIGSINVKTTAASKVKSTDEGTLKSLVGLHPLPGLILEYRHAQKMKSTYTDGLLAHVVSKRTISTTWEQCAAATGRITSSSPNMQSIPRRDEDMKIAGESFNMRKLFISRPGYKFVAVDFQQIELRTFAHLSQDEKLISVFKQPDDIFIAMTKMRLRTDDFDVSERDKTKTLMYALLYGAGVHKISEVLSVDSETTNRICGDFYRSAADICKAAMLRAESALRQSGLDASLLLQIHDELLWEVSEDLEFKVKDTVRKSIEGTLDYWTKKFKLNVPMPVKITTGSSWGSMT